MNLYMESNSKCNFRLAMSFAMLYYYNLKPREGCGMVRPRAKTAANCEPVIFRKLKLPLSCGMINQRGPQSPGLENHADTANYDFFNHFFFKKYFLLDKIMRIQYNISL